MSRIDPRTNSVTARTPTGTPQALAAGAGAAWVSVAGGSTQGALTIPACGERGVRGARSRTSWSPPTSRSRAPLSADPRGMANAIRFVLERRGFRAGEHTVGYQSCDVSTAETGGFEFRKCAANATAYGQAERLVAVIGTYSSFCAEVEIPILNRAPGGPVAMISPSNTGSGLTRGGAARGGQGSAAGLLPDRGPELHACAPREDLQGVAHAMLAKRLGLEVGLLCSTRDADWKIVHADPFRRAARRLEVGIAGSTGFDPEAKSYEALADRVARSGAQGVFLAGGLAEGGERVMKALRARLGSRVKLMVTDIFVPVPVVLEEAAAGRARRCT